MHLRIAARPSSSSVEGYSPVLAGSLGENALRAEGPLGRHRCWCRSLDGDRRVVARREELEDEEGNVYNRKTYEDLKKQGLI